MQQLRLLSVLPGAVDVLRRLCKDAVMPIRFQRYCHVHAQHRISLEGEFVWISTFGFEILFDRVAVALASSNQPSHEEIVGVFVRIGIVLELHSQLLFIVEAAPVAGKVHACQSFP